MLAHGWQTIPAKGVVSLRLGHVYHLNCGVHQPYELSCWSSQVLST